MKSDLLQKPLAPALWFRVYKNKAIKVEQKMKNVTIGQLAREAGVKVSTIRFYECSNLLTQPGRNLSGYRQYTMDSLKLLKLIIRSKELGFTLEEISEL